MDVKDIIRKRREELKLTYEQLGNMVGVGKSTVRKWETGMIENMRRDNIIALANALNISPAIIMGWEEPQEDVLSSKKLSESEETLLSDYNKLNNLGKNEASKRVAELTEISKYINDNDLCVTSVIDFPKNQTYTFAAHDDDLDEETAKRNITKAKAIFEEMDKEN